MPKKLYKTIDSHIHCGIQHVHQPYAEISTLLEAADIEAACMFAPVEDIYDRYSGHFTDTVEWQQCRTRANNYLKQLAQNHPVFPYFFVWNDFAVNQLTADFKGIKWHRHANEPHYNYHDPACEVFLQRVYQRQLPIVLEEEFRHTLDMTTRIAGRTILIIPHLGRLYRKTNSFPVFPIVVIFNILITHKKIN